MAHSIDARLIKPSELSVSEREAWIAFTDANLALASPYFRVEFAECCEEARSDTRVIIARKQNEIIGFLPLQVGKVGYARPLAGPLGDVHGLIIPPGETADPFDFLSAAGVPLFEFNSATGMDQNWRRHGHVQDGSWICDTTSGYDAFLEERQKFSKSAIRTLRQRFRRLEAAEGGNEFQMDDSRPETFELVIDWKREQYQRTRVFDVFSVGWTRKLLAALMRRRSERFRGMCSSLSINGKVVAAHIGMASEKLTHYWFPVYDPEHSQISPGNLLLAELIRQAAEWGQLGVELGPGEYRYKQELGSYQIPLWQGCVITRSAPSILRGAAVALADSFERLPVSGLSTLPRRALRRADKLASFYAW